MVVVEDVGGGHHGFEVVPVGRAVVGGGVQLGQLGALVVCQLGAVVLGVVCQLGGAVVAGVVSALGPF